MEDIFQALVFLLLCHSHTAQKIKFSINFPAGLATFTAEILNGELHFMCSDRGLITVNL